MKTKRTAKITSLIGLPDDYKLTITDVAHILNEDYSSSYTRVMRGDIPSIRIGDRALRIEVVHLREFIEQRRLPRANPTSFINLKKKAV